SELPDIDVTASHEVLREEREYERSATTAVNAYVMPKVRKYLEAIRTGLGSSTEGAALAIMQSSGGVTTAEDAAMKPVYGLESGLAAGAIGAQAIARLVECEDVIALDMGGTTVKACLIESGEISRSRESELGVDMSLATRLVRGGGELVRIPTVDLAE